MGLLRVKEVVVGGIGHARLRPGLGAAARGSDAAGGGDALDARHVAKVALAAVRFRVQQEPGNRTGDRRIGAALHGADHAAAVSRRFPAWAGVMLADEVAARVEE